MDEEKVRAQMMLLSGQLAAIGVALNRVIVQSDKRELLEAEIAKVVDQLATKAGDEGTLDHLMLAKGLREQARLMVGAHSDVWHEQPPH